MFCYECHYIKAGMCRISMGSERGVGEEAGNSTHGSSWKMLVSSKTTSKTALRVELAFYPLETNRETRKLKWQYSLTRLAPIADSCFLWIGIIFSNFQVKLMPISQKQESAMWARRVKERDQEEISSHSWYFRMEKSDERIGGTKVG